MQTQPTGDFSTPEHLGIDDMIDRIGVTEVDRQLGIQSLLTHIGEPDADLRVTEWIEPFRAVAPDGSLFVNEMQETIQAWVERKPTDDADRKRISEEVRALCGFVFNNAEKGN